MSISTVEYIRYEFDDPELKLANKAITLAPGGFCDLVVPTDSPMGLEKVSYEKGLRASRKVKGDKVTYRFQVPKKETSSSFKVTVIGNERRPSFVFLIKS